MWSSNAIYSFKERGVKQFLSTTRIFWSDAKKLFFFFWLLIHAIWCCLRGGYEARYVESLYLLSVSFGGGRPATAYLLSVSSEEMTLIRFKCSSWLVCSLGLRKVNVVDGEALGAIVNTGGENLKHKIYNNARKGELFLKRLTVNRIHIWKKGVLYYV